MVHRWRGSRNHQGIDRNVEERDDCPWPPLTLCMGMAATVEEAKPNRWDGGGRC